MRAPGDQAGSGQALLALRSLRAFPADAPSTPRSQPEAGGPRCPKFLDHSRSEPASGLASEPPVCPEAASVAVWGQTAAVCPSGVNGTVGEGTDFIVWLLSRYLFL